MVVATVETESRWSSFPRLSVKGASFISFFVGSTDSNDEDDMSPTQKKRITRAFDIADVIERGCAREVATDFMVPLKKSSKLYGFTITRSEDRLEYKLYSSDGNFLMFAKVNMEKKKVEFFLYYPNTELFDAEDPSFVMTFTADKKSWLLYSTVCESCLYHQRNCAYEEVCGIEHYQEPIGEGLFNIMQLTVPGIYKDSSRVHWCLKNGYPSLKSFADGITEHEETILIENKRPQWNAPSRSLVLEFKKRNIIPSAKNFQLVQDSNKNSVMCQYGKIGANIFTLDLKYPMSIIQAFGTALSTMFWEWVRFVVGCSCVCVTHLFP